MTGPVHRRIPPLSDIRTKSRAEKLAAFSENSGTTSELSEMPRNSEYLDTEDRLADYSGSASGLRLPELNLVPIQVIDPGKAAIGFVHSFGVNLYPLLSQAVQ